MGCCCGRQKKKEDKLPVEQDQNADLADQNEAKGTKTASPPSTAPKGTPAPSATCPIPRSPPGEFKGFYYVALWDYTPDSNAELSLKVGDRVRTVDDPGGGAGPDWLFVCRVGDKCGTGYVPRPFLREEGTLDAELWYFGTLSRHDAEEILKGASEGTFLIRDRDPAPAPIKKHTPADQLYTLSVKKKTGPIKHHPVWQLPKKYGGGYFLTTKRKFESLSDMVEWYKQNPTVEDVGLVEPAVKKPPSRVPLPPDAQKHWKEIPRSQIVLGKQVGKGNFGVVYEGTWNHLGSGPPKRVAVKALKKGSAGARFQFIKEAAAMKNLYHPNLVQLYGVVSTEEPFWMVQEFVKDGSLLKYLQGRKQSRSEVPEKMLVNICLQIANGMQYLEEKRMIHRDLAARNVLVDADPVSDRISIKIADFGLAKLVVEQDAKTGRKRVRDVPTKWTAPEALDKGLYSSKSDVWSFGIVVHEVFTHGKEPYELLNNPLVRRFVVQQKQILRRDTKVPEKAYNIMKQCFKYEAAERPTFKELCSMFITYSCDPLDPPGPPANRPPSPGSPPGSLQESPQPGMKRSVLLA